MKHRILSMTMSLCLACTISAQSAEKIVPIKYGKDRKSVV